MKQITKLRFCNWILLVLIIVVLMSGIQLEIQHGEKPEWIWIHIVICGVFMMFCGWHIWLHFKKSNWFEKFRRLRSQVTRMLWWISIVTFLTGIISAIHWILSGEHSPVGAVHGKFGFLMIVLAAAHAIKRHKFYLRK